jgi:cycloartenol synthase
MWRLKSGSDTGGHPLLRSLNDFQGRQTWEFDQDAGSHREREAVKAAQEAFTANRLQQKHSADLLLRLQCTGKIEDQASTRGAVRIPPGVEPLPKASQLRKTHYDAFDL